MAQPRTGRPLRYRRVLVKLSGEALMGKNGYGIDVEVLNQVAADICEAADLGLQLCVVIGGGNIYRGLAAATDGMDRVSGDYMGMLATVLNGLALGQALDAKGRSARVMSAIPMLSIAEPFIRARALAHLDDGHLVVFVGGTGNPFFTTDTTAALRAAEMGCDAIFKATQVDGVYDSDPAKNPKAARYDALSYDDVLRQNLRIMDGAAIALARDNRIPIIVFSIKEKGGLAAVLQGKGSSTTIS
jgi:uridylate kinase